MLVDKYEYNRKDINFIKKYTGAKNASSASEVDANANVESKNITTLGAEIHKKDNIYTNRLMMYDKIKELYDEDLAEEYLRQLESHEIYRHDEAGAIVGTPYCASISMYPFLLNGLKTIGGKSGVPKHLRSFCGGFINLVFAVSSQLAGACSTPEFISYLDYFIRKEYGNDYYLKTETIINNIGDIKTIGDVIDACFDQVVYSINQPAAARGYQSVFWNIAYFDKNYFKQLFDEFVFPDATPMIWDSVNWLQKRFMVWFNNERTKEILTFPVETVSLLDNGTDYVDKEWKDFVAEMYANGHSFFTYRSNSVDSLASCCFSGDTMVLTKSSSGVMYKTFDELVNQTPYSEKKNLTVFHNGSWISAKTVKLPKKNMYRISTVNGKELFLTEDHICVTDSGEKLAKNISESDYMMFSTLPLNSFPEVDRKLTYEQGFFIGMYLGDGSMSSENSSNTTTIQLSLNEQKYNCSINIIKKAILDCDSDAEYKLGKPYNNVYPTTIRSNDLAEFIRSFVSGNYCFEKELNLNCLLQSLKFRQGILDGYYATDGGNSNRIYTTSEKLCGQIECLMTSLGLVSVLNVSDRTDEVVIIRGKSFTRNYPLYCIRWYDRKNKRNIKDLYKVINNCTYFKVGSIQSAEYTEDFVYCFEVDREEEPYFTLPNGIITHNCRLRNEFTDNTFSYTLGAGGVSTGSKCVMTINMNRLVQNATKNGLDIPVAVREQTDKLHKYLTAFNEILKEMKALHMIQIYDAGFIEPQKQYLTLGINGLVESAEFLGIKISPNKEYETYVKSIFETIYTQNKLHKTKELMFNTEQVPAENLGIKNAKWDKKDGYFVPRDCYNSYIYLVEDDSVNILDKFMMHGGEFTSKLDGGSALHANLEEHLTKDQYIKLIEVAIKTGCSYFTFNIPNTICNDCSNISKHKLKICPKCGSFNLDYAVRIIGYLKRISSFSDGRQIEESKRVYH